MSFMKPQIYETDYIYVDGPNGGEIIPCDVVDPLGVDAPDKYTVGKDGAIPGPLRMYCENRTAYTIERKHGFVGRMSAPGYMDATEWIAGDSEAKVKAELDNLYGDDEE